MLGAQMKVRITFAVVWLIFVFSMQSVCFAEAREEISINVEIPKEPGWKAPSYRGWELISLPGLISTYYDLNLDGTLDYMVIRKILRKSAADKMSIKEAIDSAKYDGLTLYVSKPVIYFTSKFPLFYCIGLDYRKNCENMWVDIGEDGLNGNEEHYTLSTAIPGVR